MVGALQVSLDDEIMLMSQNGVLVRTPVKDISVVGRNTQGVRLIRLEEGDQLSGLERIEGLAGDGDARPTRRVRRRRRRCADPRRADRSASRRHPKTSRVRAFNFSPGPAVLPLEVLEQARDELLDWHGSGMSVMEISHRSKAFMRGGGRGRGGFARADGDTGATTRCCSCRAAPRRSSPWCP